MPGLQPERFEGAAVFVLPNPSGRNANFSYAQMLKAFRSLKRLGESASQDVRLTCFARRR